MKAGVGAGMESVDGDGDEGEDMSEYNGDGDMAVGFKEEFEDDCDYFCICLDL